MLQSEKKQVDIVSQGTNTHGKGKDGVGGMRMMSWKTIILIRFSLVCLSPPTTDSIFSLVKSYVSYTSRKIKITATKEEDAFLLLIHFKLCSMSRKGKLENKNK